MAAGVLGGTDSGCPATSACAGNGHRHAGVSACQTVHCESYDNRNGSRKYVEGKLHVLEHIKFCVFWSFGWVCSCASSFMAGVFAMIWKVVLFSGTYSDHFWCSFAVFGYTLYLDTFLSCVWKKRQILTWDIGVCGARL